jgi:hypothetical protein
MVYYSILAIGQNDYMPKNEEEYAFCMIVLLFSAILNTIIFGNIASMASSVAAKSLHFQHMIDDVNSVMDDLKLHESVKTQVREFFKKTLMVLGDQEDFDHFLSQLKPSLKIKI